MIEKTRNAIENAPKPAASAVRATRTANSTFDNAERIWSPTVQLTLRDPTNPFGHERSHHFPRLVFWACCGEP